MPALPRMAGQGPRTRREWPSHHKVAPMLIVEPRLVLEKVSGFPLRAFERGDIVLSEGSETHRLLFLNRGAVDVVKDEVQLTRVSEPGAVFGDMSVLLGLPHTADVLAVEPSSFYIVDHAEGLLRQEPLLALYVATVLARRLDEVNGHLIRAWGRAGTRAAPQILHRDLAQVGRGPADRRAAPALAPTGAAHAG